MITTADIMPFADTVGSGFFIGLITGYAIKKVIKLAAVIVGIFIAVLAYLEYQRILNVDWERIQVVLQNGIAWVTEAVTHVSNHIGATHTGVLSNGVVPLASSVSAGIVLGLARG